MSERILNDLQVIHKQWTATLFLRGCLDLIDLSMKR